MIEALQKRVNYFKDLKDKGFKLSAPIDDNWAEFEPPASEDLYWVQCRSNGCYLKLPRGEVPPIECPECGKNLDEYEI